MLEKSQEMSGQVINKAKKLFFGNVDRDRKIWMKGFLGIPEGQLPAKYLFFPIVRGKPSKHHMLPLFDKVLAKFPAWKGFHKPGVWCWPSTLSIVCPSIASLSIDGPLPLSKILSIYKIRNLFWSGNPEKQKSITVAWDQACKPLDEGGLNIRKLAEVNKAMLIKLAWSIWENPSGLWSRYMRAKYFHKDETPFHYHKHSSIWPGIKSILHLMEERTQGLGGLLVMGNLFTFGLTAG